MKRIIWGIFFTIVVITASGCVEKKVYSDIEKNNFIVKFGIFNDDSYTLKEETTKIPLKYKETGFSVGYVIYAKDKKSFKEFSIAYPPKPGIAGREVRDTGMKNGLKGPIGSSVKGSIGHKFGFDEGDPLGKWLLEIYVDDNFITEIEFEVVEQNKG